MGNNISIRFTNALGAGMVLLVVLSTCVAPAWADGGFIPSFNVEQVPGIPSQTALVVHDRGTQTLVVESAMGARGGESFAWIVPVPAEPIVMEAESPGLLRNLEVCFAPRILGPADLPSILIPLGLLIGVLLLT